MAHTQPQEGSNTFESTPSTTITTSNNERKNHSSRRNRRHKTNNNTPSRRDGEEKPRRGRKTTTRKRLNNNKQQRPWWHKHIPDGTVDPITLEDLTSLRYPPFALRATAPYLPVPEFPPTTILSNDQDNVNTAAVLLNSNNGNAEMNLRERERRVLKDQWGRAVPSTTSADKSHQQPPQTTATTKQRQQTPNAINLFDGRALAYYMTSQLQFIDPLNRRDLEREELVHLDRYLRRHGFAANVVEAYDAKGMSLSTAGAASTTAAGRAQMRQEEAQVLLHALFDQRRAAGTRSRGSQQPRSKSGSRRSSNPLAQQYHRYQQAQDDSHHHQQQRASQQQSQTENAENYTSSSESSSESDRNENGWGSAVYGDQDEGMMVIDDDQNPGMRGSNSDQQQSALVQTAAEPVDQFPRLAQTRASPAISLWGANPIARNSSNRNSFPALPSVLTKGNVVSSRTSKTKLQAREERERQILNEQWGRTAILNLVPPPTTS